MLHSESGLTRGPLRESTRDYETGGEDLLDLSHLTSPPIARFVASEAPSTTFTERDRKEVDALFTRVQLKLRFFMLNSLFHQITAPGLAEVMSKESYASADPKSRFEGTRAFVKTIVRTGFQSNESRAVVDRVRALHEQAGVDPNSQEFEYVLYTLSHVLTETLRYKSGVVPNKRQEHALYRLFTEVGYELGRTLRAGRYSQFVRRNKSFEEKNLARPSLSSQLLANELLDQSVEIIYARLQ